MTSSLTASNELDFSEDSSSRRRRKGGWNLTQEYGGATSDDEDDAQWNPARRRLHKILGSFAADVTIGGVIAVSLAVVIAETDATVDGDDPPETIQIMNIGFTALSFVELIVRLYVYRLKFFSQWFNVMDFLIVIVDIGSRLYQQSSIVRTLRIFRLVKLARVLVLLVKFPELHMILRGIYCTIKSIFWGMCFLSIIIMIWSILGVQLIHPINKEIDYGDCERCSRAFAGVFNSFLTIFQTVVAGDSWGQLAVPIIEHYPPAMAYFSAVFVSISLLVLNLILATTVERAAQAKDEDEMELNRRRMEEKRKSYQFAEKRLKVLCKEMDKDKSGALTLDELQDGYKCHPEFRKEMKAMDIREDDMKTVFRLLDADESGDVNYAEFVESLHMMKTRDSHTLLMFTYHLVEDIVSKSAAQLKVLTTKRGGLVKSIADEVTAKTIRELGPLIEKSTKATEPHDLWPYEKQDEEVFPTVEEFTGREWRKPSKEGLQEQKLEQAGVVASALDMKPPIVPVTPLAEALDDKDGRDTKATAQTASFAARCHRNTEEDLEEALAAGDTFKKAKDAGETRDRRPSGERRDRRSLGASRQQGHPLLGNLQVVPEQLSQIATAVQRIERAIYFIGGAGKHSLWCPRCPPRGKEVDGALLQQGLEDHKSE